jgi:putative hemolysin
MPTRNETAPTEPRKLIDLQASLPNPAFKALMVFLGPVLERLLAFDELNETYARIQQDVHTLNFFERCLRAMDIAYSISEADLAKIPQSGPVVVVSNHPLGGLDGIIIGAMLTSLRDDVKLLANHLLGRMPEIRPWLIEVDPFETDQSAKANLKPMKQAIAHLKAGGLLMTFPAGTVSHFQWDKKRIADPQWNPNTARLAQKSGATVVPMRVEGINSWLFQAAGVVHPRIRTLLLPYEMVRRYGSTISLKVASPLPPKRIAEFDSPQKLTEFLRLNAYVLRKRQDEQPRRRFAFKRIPKGVLKRAVDVAPPVPAKLLSREIDQLPPQQCLVDSHTIKVYLATAQQVPNVLSEIGRLRELTFREVDEGTGRATDIDRFDLYYQHLFLWDTEAKAIAGAYRIGLTDQILKERGPAGLYTATLFRYKPGFLESLGPSMEMGRSFIAAAYQKKHATLGLLWRGIGAYVVQNPQYAVLFGPVSISKAYNALSKDLMVKFLAKHSSDPLLGPLVKARRPPRKSRSAAPEKAAAMDILEDTGEVSALISEIETDQKGLPILLRHYLKMNARVLAFNVDPSFGNCLDSLIVTDLRQSDQKLLRGYLGQEGLQHFLNYWKVPAHAAQAAEAAGKPS